MELRKKLSNVKKSNTGKLPLCIVLDHIVGTTYNFSKCSKWVICPKKSKTTDVWNNSINSSPKVLFTFIMANIKRNNKAGCLFIISGFSKYDWFFSLWKKIRYNLKNRFHGFLKKSSKKWKVLYLNGANQKALDFRKVYVTKYSSHLKYGSFINHVVKFLGIFDIPSPLCGHFTK